MKVLGGDWSKAKGGFRGYPLSWIKSDGLHGVGKLGTNAPRRPNEIHVDLSGGLVSALTLDQIALYSDGCMSNKDMSPGSIVPSMIEPEPSRSPPFDRRSRTVTASRGPPKCGRSSLTLPVAPGPPLAKPCISGSPQSQTLLRIYDKRLEMQSKERENWQEFGVRWELEFKKTGLNSVPAPWRI
jgi:phage replication initiation protein